MIEAITGEPYPVWIKREIVDAAGLKETVPNMPLAKGTPFARGHTRRQPLGRRLVIPGDNSTNAITSAAGFVATAADTARFFGQLAPGAKKSVISQASRREMTRRHWRVPGSAELHYGLGVACGKSDGFDWFGHGGGFQGYLSRTAVLAESDVAVTILSNSIDGWAPFWMEGCFHILRAFKTRGAPERRLRDWAGRWWTIWNAIDLVPMGNRVLVANPHLISPFMDASEIEIVGPRPRPHHRRGRLRQLRRARAPRTQQIGQGHRHLARRRRLQAGEDIGRGDGAQISAGETQSRRLARLPYFISPCTSPRNACREASRE